MSGILKRISTPMLLALGIALAAGIVTTWPLPLHVDKGISAIHRSDIGGMRVSIPGDHLQLMYFFQLTREFLSGELPFFYNVYEFNTGDDSARYELDAYYIPFSLVFAVVEMVTGNPALAWNLTCLFSLWLGALGVLLLTRRFSSAFGPVLLATLVSTVLPYRLATFLHGSPTGFGIAYVPFFLLGLDRAIRDKSYWGAGLAGAIFFTAEWVDLHTYFFLTLLAPFWCLFVFFYQNLHISWKRIFKTAVAMIPMFAFVLLASVRIWIIHSTLQDSVMASGRTVTEVAQFSPHFDAYWSLDPDHPSSYVYMTFLAPIIFIVGLFFAAKSFVHQKSSEKKRCFIFMLIMFLACFGVLMLGLGPHMPLPKSVRLWEMLTRLVPPYRMIRQSAKVLILMPSLLAVLLVLPFSPAFGNKRSRWNNGVFGILAVLLLFEVGWRMDPTISLIDKEQGAYAAIAEDAERRGEDPRAVAIVLWPGDTHWSSLNQYYGMKYRIRMVNGYRPRVPTTYIDDVFMKYVGLNRGYVDDDQLDDLLDAGIRYVVLHEDAFPEKVSPFSVSYTLGRLLANPRLKLLKQDRAVWAFEVTALSSENLIAVPWSTTSIARYWDAENHLSDDSARKLAIDAHGGVCARLSPGTNDVVQIPLWGTHYENTLRFSVRVRGRGVMRTHISSEGIAQTLEMEIQDEDWRWVDVPLPAFEGFQFDISLLLSAVSGEVDVDYVYLSSGVVPDRIEVGEVFRMPAPTLFHAGYTDLDTDRVVFEPELVPDAYVLYGPRFPLPVGTYRVRLWYDTKSTKDIGHAGFRSPWKDTNQETVVAQGDQDFVELTYQQIQNLPFTFQFYYNRTAPVELLYLEVERLE